MSSELIINTRHYETRVALVENGLVVELHIERSTGQELMGNIYHGRVVRILPGMQAAFVDIGQDRKAFLYVADVHRESLDIEELMLKGSTQSNEAELLDHDSPSSIVLSERHCNIEEMLHEGQDIMVQVAKEPIGTKGARLTSYISLPGRHLVLLPTVDHIGISRRIEDPDERQRLKDCVQELRSDKSGYIVRTVSENVQGAKLKAEMDFLLKLWSEIQTKMSKSKRPGLLYKDISVSLRVVRDLFTQEVDRLVIDSSEEYERIIEFVEKFAPALRYSIELYRGEDPIFDSYGIEMDISRALENKIWLKSGGYIIIEMTEALTSIDINTGSYVGKRNLEETILKTNLEAVKELAYQLRLRNIGGLIVIDFIDMEKPENRQRVFTSLREELLKDKAKTNVLKMSELGLIEMTRKRTKENLGRLLMEPCSYCEGMGRIKSRKTICYEIFRDLEREPGPVSDSDDKIYVQANPEIANVLKEDEQQSIIELEKSIRRRIIILSQKDFHMEQYSIST